MEGSIPVACVNSGVKYLKTGGWCQKIKKIKKLKH